MASLTNTPSPDPNNNTQAELRINCPDEVGLGCDITRLMLDFGLTILQCEMTTDGRWCFLVMHVALAAPARVTQDPNWKLLKQRLEALCMPANAWAILQRRNSSAFEAPSQRAAFLLQIASTSNAGFLHGMLIRLVFGVAGWQPPPLSHAQTSSQRCGSWMWLCLNHLSALPQAWTF